MKSESDRKSVNHACVQASAQSFERCEGHFIVVCLVTCPGALPWRRSLCALATRRTVPAEVQGSFISHYLHKINIERKVKLKHMITR